MPEAGLQQRLSNDSAVSALVGNHIYPLVWPSDQPDFPLITYQRISTVTDNALLGVISLVTIRVQFDAWAKRYSVVRAIAKAIASSLESFSGTLPDGTFVFNITQDSSTDLYDSPTSTFRITSDYLIQFRH